MIDFMLKYKRKICVLTVILSLLVMNTAQNVPVTLHEPLCRALQATGAELDKAYITGCVQADLSASELGELKWKIQEIAERLGAQSDCLWEIRQSNYQQYWQVSFNQVNKQGIVAVKKLTEPAAGKNRVEFTIELILTIPEELAIIQARTEILAILQKIQLSPQISTCLEGHLDGKLRKDVVTYCLQDAFAVIGAKRITHSENQYYVSDTGYSSLLPDTMQAGSANVNFNIAMRYHAFDQRTYVIIGSPVITIEY